MPLDTNTPDTDAAVKTEPEKDAVPTTLNSSPAKEPLQVDEVKVEHSAAAEKTPEDKSTVVSEKTEIEPVKNKDTSASVEEKATKPKGTEDKTEGAKADGDNESLEVLVDDTQNDLDADLQKGESSDAKASEEISEPKASTEGDACSKPGDSSSKTGEGESKPDEKKLDDKRLVGFV